MTTSEFLYFEPSELVFSSEDFANLSRARHIRPELNENPNKALLVESPSYRWIVKGGHVEYELQYFLIHNDGSRVIKCYWCPMRKSEKARQTLQKRKSDEAYFTRAPKTAKVIEMVTIDEDYEPAATPNAPSSSFWTNQQGSQVMPQNQQLLQKDNEHAPTLNAPSSAFWNHHQENVKIKNRQEELMNENEQLRATIATLQKAIVNLQQQFDDFKDAYTLTRGRDCEDIYAEINKLRSDLKSEIAEVRRELPPVRPKSPEPTTAPTRKSAGRKKKN
ncbi:hypothetical protein B9Z55_022156 [Caenorhabditis nigoni]|uniref:Uncharacterized protein n=1 Tax=Caenorhabditis nigoni TaxID=1611254 RepID=A0A2G5TV70_9PELO|nr:hypothetical protein B9Z55_022156 [Caenorhabditis nigoni]